MQAKMMLNRLKKIEKKVLKPLGLYVFFGEPSKTELAKLPPNSRIVIFLGEDELKD